MKYHSNLDSTKLYSSTDAILSGLAPDGGLFVPQTVPRLPDSILSKFPDLELDDLLVEMLFPFLQDSLSRDDLSECITKAIDFPTPLVFLDESIAVLELFHGPTCAFKDYGARFMAQLFSKLQKNDSTLTVLVATSGDTGGAVAAGFHRVPGTRVIVLYPSGQVSPLQELQLTTWGDNIHAIEIDGSFDDCQHLVKQAFVDEEVSEKLQITSANSINIARLLPQSLYYVIAAHQAKTKYPDTPLYFSVPSGNLGNISAGLLAAKRGLPIDGFYCAVNDNKGVADFLNGEQFRPNKSLRTLSNAMDVGNPSNFLRMCLFAGETNDTIRKLVRGSSVNDSETLSMMQQVFSEYDYLCDPHTAVGFVGAMRNREQCPDALQIVVSTAHPGKFSEVIAKAQLPLPKLPEQLSILAEKQKAAADLSKDYNGFRRHLLSNFA